MQQIKTTLYGKDKSGGLKIWEVFVNENIISVFYGKLGGKIQEKQTVCYGKNIGKANQTTDAQQAIAEAEAKWSAQYLKGYRETIEDLSVDVTQAMLAQDASKKPHLIEYPCCSMKKIDGNRTLVTFENGYPVFNTRGHKTYPVHKHIAEQLIKLKEESNLDSFDGEFYIHGVPLQTINSLVKKIQTDSSLLEFHIFDIPSEKQWVSGFKVVKEGVEYQDSRFTDLYNNVGFYLRDREKYPSLFVVDSEFCYNEQEVKDSIGRFMQEGYEGTIIRNFKGLYEYGHRSNDLLKWKLFMDTEAFVEDCEMDKNQEGVLHCSLKDGTKFKCKMIGSHEERLFIKQKLLIGKFITVKYQALTIDGVPQFPVGINVREVNPLTWEPIE